MRRIGTIMLMIVGFFAGITFIYSCGGGGSGGGGPKPDPGTLDTSFGTGGVALIDQYIRDFAYAIAADSTGRIFAAGYTDNGSIQEMTLWCLDDNGALDPSFGTGGVAMGGGNGAYGMAVDSSDRIVVVGRWSTLDMAAWRFDTDGNLDTSFGINGVLTHDGAAWAGSGSGDYDRALSAVIDNSGRILTSGESINANIDDDMVVWKITESGTLDFSFGGDFSPADGIPDGFAVHNGAASTGTTSSDYGYEIALDSNSKIVVGGQSDDHVYDPHMTIWKYNTDGTLDTTFGGDFNPSDGMPDGFVVFPDVSSSETLTVDSSDRIIAAGVNYSSVTTVQGLSIWRYNSSGVLDTTFGGDISPADGTRDGFTIFNSIPASPTAVAVDGSGRILVAGAVDQSGELDMVLFRFDSNGMLDTTFGGDDYPADGTPDGFVVYDNRLPVIEIDMPRSIHIDDNGRILLAGGIITGSFADLAVWRFHP